MKSAICLPLLVGTLFVAGCAKIPGGFCDTARPMVIDNVESVDWLLDNEPGLAMDILGHNTFGERVCDWDAPDTQ